MRVLVGAVGRLKDGPERDLYQKYSQRLDDAGRSLAIGPLKLVEIVEGRQASAGQRQTDEGLRLMDGVRDADFRVALDAGGRTLSSEAFANLIARHRDDGVKAMAFLIGGPDGHGGDVLNMAHLKLSLGPMILPHGLARIVLAEQLYRATTILSGHPYHKGH